jgi:hypothetical protein
MSMADAIVASYKKWERKPADLYPTPVDATESIMPLLGALQDHGYLPSDIIRVLEPACGDGRISRVLEWHGMEVTSSDLREFSGYGVGKVDFLSPGMKALAGHYDLLFTNPPFSLAWEFLEQARAIAPVVVFLVKQNFWNTKGRLKLWDENRPTFFLPITWRLAFLQEERGKSPLMDCAWCVWIRDYSDEECFFEPIRKKVYPGYHGKGVKGSLAGLTEAVDELAASLRIKLG